MKQSNFLSLNMRDIAKGLLMAVLTPAVFIIEQVLETGNLTFNWKQIGVAALTGGLAYLVKNFLSTPAAK